jgi:hypothetical protein
VTTTNPDTNVDPSTSSDSIGQADTITTPTVNANDGAPAASPGGTSPASPGGGGWTSAIPTWLAWSALGFAATWGLYGLSRLFAGKG